jgi:co-chaperonin GroES (HSP10)
MANFGKPLGDRVLLKLEDTEKTSSGGIIINHTTQMCKLQK